MTSLGTTLPVDESSTLSTDFATLPIEQLVGLSIEKMSPDQRQAYVKQLRAARTNGPTLLKHVKAAAANDKLLSGTTTKAKAPAKSAAKLADDLLKGL